MVWVPPTSRILNGRGRLSTIAANRLFRLRRNREANECGSLLFAKRGSIAHLRASRVQRECQEHRCKTVLSLIWCDFRGLEPAPAKRSHGMRIRDSCRAFPELGTFDC